MSAPAEQRDPTTAGWHAMLVVSICLLAILTVMVLCMSAVEKVAEDAERSGDFHVQLALALRNYHDVKGRFPPAALCDADGRPLLSWRVLILPFIEHNTLFEQFHFDEPWDSEHNMKLLSKMPASFAAPGRKAAKMPSFHTVCHVFVGKGAAFEGTQGLRIPDDFPDDNSTTILLIAAGKPVPWTKPENLPYDPKQPLPDLQGVFHDGFWVCTVAHNRRWVKKETSEATLRALITRNGGDRPGDDWQK
jgi:hypothetical protein